MSLQKMSSIEEWVNDELLAIVGATDKNTNKFVIALARQVEGKAVKIENPMKLSSF